MALDDIYKEVILDHYKSPRNKRELPGAELSCTRNNPLCGDEITVFAHVEDGNDPRGHVPGRGVFDLAELGLDDDGGHLRWHRSRTCSRWRRTSAA